MKILCDTSVLVEIDRQNLAIAKMLKKAIEDGHEIFISIITVSEILTGSHLRKDSKEASIRAKNLLNQFEWINIDGEVAEISAELLAMLIAQKRIDEIEYQDILIASSFIASKCDLLVTLNKKDFILLPKIREFVNTPEEFTKKRL